FLFVARRKITLARQNPNLQQMAWLSSRWIALAVRDPAAGGHTLYVAGTNHGTIAHAVPMLQRAGQNVSDDFHVAMRVRGETLCGRDSIFVDHAQRAEMHMRRIEILIEREGVISVEPSKIEVAAF